MKNEELSGKRREFLKTSALLAGGVLTTALTFLPLVMAGAAAVGTGASWMIIAFVTLRQEETPPGMQGRTAAVTQVMTNLPQVGASMLAAVLIGIAFFKLGSRGPLETVASGASRLARDGKLTGNRN